jgi:hypothetical protein
MMMSAGMNHLHLCLGSFGAIGMRVIGELSTDLAGIASEAEPVGMLPAFLTILQQMDSGDLHWHERLQNMLR